MSLIFCLSAGSLSAFADPSWKMLSDKDGIKVYSMQIPGSDLIAFKGVKVMPAPITKVAQLLMDSDAEKKKHWIDMIKDFDVLEEGKDHLVSYSSYDLPWPLEDRDYVIHSEMHIDNVSNQITFDLKSTEHAKSPRTIGVRALLSQSKYILVPKPGQATEVTVEIQTDPKGQLPKWLVNFIQKGWPSNTLKKMENEVLKPGAPESERIKAEFKGARELAKS